MLSKNDLIYFGAMMFLGKQMFLEKHEWITEANEDDAIKIAREMFDKVWNDGNDKMITE